MKFRSCEQAIKFSFNISDRAEYAASDPLRIRSTSVQALSPMDLHAQAAMILSAVNRLHHVERDAVLAMHGRGKPRTDAIRGLSKYLYPSLSQVIPSIGELQLMLLHWSTKRPSIRGIAEERGVSYRKVCTWRTAVLRAWIPLQVRGIGRLHEVLFGPGGFELDE